MKSHKLLFFILSLSLILISCATDSNNSHQSESEEQNLIASEKQNVPLGIDNDIQNEESARKNAEGLERERKEKAIYDQYSSNSLGTGSTPYSNCYGENSKCSVRGCSEISVIAPNNSDVLVTIKSHGETVQHAYIQAGGSYSFELLDGTYQPFFYYGTGWNPEKIMKESACGTITGGFLRNEDFGKDDPQILSNGRLQYTLVLQDNGNFSTIPSDSNEAL